ncbi:MAG: Xaa-Pro peptidase family protein [Hyphomicrobiales bacterium]|nr:Xaa-Pro peptidase family protein [Hyphomicrobiales bacterium]
MTNVRNDPRLLREMERDGLDALLAFSMENVFYLSGSLFALQDNIRERLSVCGLVRDGTDFLICAQNEVSAVEAKCHVGRIETYAEFDRSPIELLASLLEEQGLGSATIGVEKRYLMTEFYEELAARLPKARLIASDRAIEAARAVKSPEHIGLIAKASRATEDAVADAFAAMRPGMSERALATAILEGMHDRGAQVMRHNIVTVGDNARHAHPYPSPSKRLDPGDVVRIDVGGLFDGYGSDIARMAVVGRPDERQTEIYGRVRGCVHSIGPAMRAGMAAKEVYRAAVEYYAANGISGYRRDHVGHSLSILGGHDNPMLHRGNDMLLEAGMVIALEPILTDETGRRYTVEDTFEVKAEGAELLTSATETSKMAVIA